MRACLRDTRASLLWMWQSVARPMSTGSWPIGTLRSTPSESLYRSVGIGFFLGRYHGSGGRAYDPGVAFLNLDLGELPDEPDELYALADVANVACGGHAGDAGTVARAVARCRVGGATV